MQNLTDYKVIRSTVYKVMIIADYPPYTTKMVDTMAKTYNLKTPTWVWITVIHKICLWEGLLVKKTFII